MSGVCYENRLECFSLKPILILSIAQLHTSIVVAQREFLPPPRYGYSSNLAEFSLNWDLVSHVCYFFLVTAVKPGMFLTIQNITQFKISVHFRSLFCQTYLAFFCLQKLSVCQNLFVCKTKMVKIKPNQPKFGLTHHKTQPNLV